MNPVDARYLLNEIDKQKLKGADAKFVRNVEWRIGRGMYLSVKQGAWLKKIHRRTNGDRKNNAPGEACGSGTCKTK